MNSQIKSLTIAAIIGLALSILGQASSVLTNGYVTPLDRFNPFNAEILAYWIGALGGLPLILIVGVVMVTWRKTGLRFSILNCIGAIVTVALIICLSIITLAAVEHPNKDTPLAAASADRATFIKSTSASCVTRQQSAPENKSVSAAAINDFCTCYGNSLADVTTMDELEYMVEHHGPSPSLTAKINAAFQKCVQLASTKQ
jgi:hypothetical protein